MAEGEGLFARFRELTLRAGLRPFRSARGASVEPVMSMIEGSNATSTHM